MPQPDNISWQSQVPPPLLNAWEAAKTVLDDIGEILCWLREARQSPLGVQKFSEHGARLPRSCDCLVKALSPIGDEFSAVASGVERWKEWSASSVHELVSHIGAACTTVIIKAVARLRCPEDIGMEEWEKECARIEESYGEDLIAECARPLSLLLLSQTVKRDMWPSSQERQELNIRLEQELSRAYHRRLRMGQLGSEPVAHCDDDGQVTARTASENGQQVDVMVPDAAQHPQAALSPENDRDDGNQETPADTASTIRLHKDDVTLLRALAENYYITMTQEELESETLIGRRTIGKRLGHLREQGLTHRPQGERGGETITEKGLKRLDQPHGAPKSIWRLG
jgi:hypothetical protein